MKRPGEESSRGKEVVVITGASAGVGRATVREFARHGASIGLIARGTDGLEAAREEVEAMGGEAIAIPTDVADYRAVEAAADKIEEALGPIDIWVNVAMTSIFAPFKQITPEEFKRVTDVTYLGYVWGTMAALKRMLPRDRGVIVQAGSALSKRSIPLQSAYCGAKHAIDGFTQSLRTELLHDKSNVKVRIAQLPGINTPQFGWVRSKLPNRAQPVPPIYQPEVVARALYWLAHHDRRSLDIGGSTAIVLTLNKLFPGLGDRYLALTGFKSQQTNVPRDPSAPDNLFEPVPGDHGAHGDFDARAHKRSFQVWVNENRGVIAASLLAALGGIAADRFRRSRGETPVTIERRAA